MREQWKGFKAYDVEGECFIPDESINVRSDGRVYTYQDDEDRWIEDKIEIIILPTFPEPDSKGNKCWSGDILEDVENNCFALLFFNNFEWRYVGFGVGSMDMNSSKFHKTYTKKATRICSAFDQTATVMSLTGLDPETITNLKQMIGVK